MDVNENDEDVVFTMVGAVGWLGGAVSSVFGLRSEELLVPDTLSVLLSSGLLGATDRALVADLSSPQPEYSRHVRCGPSRWYVLAPAVLVVCIAAAVYLPQFVLLPLAALLCSIGGAAVAGRLRLAAGRIAVADFCSRAAALRSTSLKCVRLLQESHLMARGVTLCLDGRSSGDSGAEAAFSAQFGQLLQASGVCLSAACRQYGQALLRLRSETPLMDGVDPAGLACDDLLPETVANQSSYDVKHVKALQHLFCECQSEFVRRCCLCLMPELLSEEAGRPRVPLGLLADLSGSLAGLERGLSAAYRGHVSAWSAEPAAAAAAAAAGPAGSRPLFVAVHSVLLQAEAAALRSRALQDTVCGADGGPPGRLRAELAEIRRRLETGQLLCDQAELQLDKAECPAAGPAPGPAAAASLLPPPPPPPPPPPLDLPEPEIVDQFFEAVVEGGPQVSEEDWQEVAQSGEERLRRRVEKERARDLLRELDSALAPKRHEWRLREAAAKGERLSPAAQSRCRHDQDESEAPRTETGHLADACQVDKSELYRFSDSDEGEVLPAAADLTYLLAVPRRARPPARRLPSRPAAEPRPPPLGFPAELSAQAAALAAQRRRRSQHADELFGDD